MSAEFLVDFENDLTDYNVFQIIGTGGFGNIYKAYDIFNNVYAIKLVNLKNPVHQILISNEVNILNYLKQKGCINNILCFIKSIPNNNNTKMAIITEYIDGIDMFKLLEINNFRLPLNDILVIFLNIIKAIFYITEHGICHNDLKPDNIMIKNNYDIVLIDFGLSCVSDSQISKLYSISSCSEIIGGTLEYASPERMIKQVVDQIKSEIYSLGIIFYITIIGFFPYKKSLVNQFKYNNLKNKLNPTDYPDELYNLIISMLNYNYNDRPDLSKIYDILEDILKKNEKKI